jgi:hypothetical protein
VEAAAADRADARKQRLGRPVPPRTYTFSGIGADTTQGAEDKPGPKDAFGSGISFEQAMGGTSSPAIAKVPGQGDGTQKQELEELKVLVEKILTIVQEIKDNPPVSAFS